VIIGGDFNESPENEPISGVMEQSFTDLFTVMLRQEDRLAEEQAKNYPAFTTFKYREESGYVKRTIDYFFMAKNQYFENKRVKVLALLDP